MRTVLIIFLFYTLTAGTIFGQTFTADPINGCDSMATTFTLDNDISATDYLWDFGNGKTDTVKNPTTIYDSVGLYSVELILDGTDTIKKNDYIFVRPNPDADFFYTDTLTLGSYAIRFDAPWYFDTVHYTYHWVFGDGSEMVDSVPYAEYKYASAGNYNVELIITDKAGCSDEISVNINVQDKFKVPNVFTPNGDGKNDIFRVVSNGHTPLTISIFSRNGSLVYKNTAPVIIWDGVTPNGIEAKQGVYYYVIYTEDKTYEKTGFLHLFR